MGEIIDRFEKLLERGAPYIFVREKGPEGWDSYSLTDLKEKMPIRAAFWLGRFLGRFEYSAWIPHMIIGDDKGPIPAAKETADEFAALSKAQGEELMRQ